MKKYFKNPPEKYGVYPFRFLNHRLERDTISRKNFVDMEQKK